MMKPEFCIIGILEGNAYLYTGKDFVRNAWDEAKRWKTHVGADKAVMAMQAAGSDWQLAIIFAPAISASAFGKLAAGKPKNFSADELAARAARLSAIRVKRWPKK